jgi:hypothetical protein
MNAVFRVGTLNGAELRRSSASLRVIKNVFLSETKNKNSNIEKNAYYKKTLTAVVGRFFQESFFKGSNGVVAVLFLLNVEKSDVVDMINEIKTTHKFEIDARSRDSSKPSELKEFATYGINENKFEFFTHTSSDVDKGENILVMVDTLRASVSPKLSFATCLSKETWYKCTRGLFSLFVEVKNNFIENDGEKMRVQLASGDFKVSDIEAKALRFDGLQDFQNNPVQGYENVHKIVYGQIAPNYVQKLRNDATKGNKKLKSHDIFSPFKQFKSFRFFYRAPKSSSQSVGEFLKFNEISVETAGGKEVKALEMAEIHFKFDASSPRNSQYSTFSLGSTTINGEPDFVNLNQHTLSQNMTRLSVTDPYDAIPANAATQYTEPKWPSSQYTAPTAARVENDDVSEWS